MKLFERNRWVLLLTGIFLEMAGLYETWRPELRQITRVIDGDTLQLDNGERVRLIGVDTPEKFETAKLERDSIKSGQSHESIQEQGEKASRFTQSLCEGKRCWLEYDREERDHYGRTLAYVHLEDGKVVNEEIVRSGYGRAYTRFPFRYAQRYRDLERAAPHPYQ